MSALMSVPKEGGRGLGALLFAFFVCGFVSFGS